MNDYPEALVDKIGLALAHAASRQRDELQTATEYWAQQATAALNALGLREERTEPNPEFGAWLNGRRYVTDWEDA